LDFLNYLRTLFSPDCLSSVERLSRFVSNNQHICSKFATQIKAFFASAEKADNAERFVMKQQLLKNLTKNRSNFTTFYDFSNNML